MIKSNRRKTIRKLVVFGCSFTDYFQWPTWADWMGHYYTEYEKHSAGGVGNKAIFNYLLEYLDNNPDLSNTDIVVQWSSCTREDRMKNLSETEEYKYKQCGTLFNTYCYDEDFTSKYFSGYQGLFETTNYISAAKYCLSYRKVNYAMTFMLDPRIGSFLGEPGFNPNNKQVSVKELEDCADIYQRLDTLIDGNFTEKCLTMHQFDHPVDVYSFTDNTTNKVNKEGHPSPKQHYTFFKKYITPLFSKVAFTETSYILNLVEDWEEYAKIKLDCNGKKHLEPKHWPVPNRYMNFNIIAKYENRIL